MRRRSFWNWIFPPAVGSCPCMQEIESMMNEPEKQTEIDEDDEQEDEQEDD